MRELVGYTDYLVIATARNERQAKAIHDDVHLRLKRDHGLLPARVEGEREAQWMLADYLDCVLHILVPRCVTAIGSSGCGARRRASSWAPRATGPPERERAPDAPGAGERDLVRPGA